jgi:hypothetical protein
MDKDNTKELPLGTMKGKVKLTDETVSDYNLTTYDFRAIPANY